MPATAEDTKPKLAAKVEVILPACPHPGSLYDGDYAYEDGEFTLHLDAEHGIIDVVAPCGEAQTAFRVADLEEAIKILKANTPKGRKK